MVRLQMITSRVVHYSVDCIFLTTLKNSMHVYSQAEELDGIDLDFEGIQSIEEWKSYLSFIAMASKHLHSNNFILSVALHPQQILPANICNSIDRVHVMTYDMQPSPQDERNNHHASMDAVHRAIASFSQKGACDPSVLVMGIPAYARHGSNMGLVKTYSEIVDDILKDKSNDEMDEIVQSIRSWEGYEFDSADDVRAKAYYAKQHGLKGIFLWEIGQDKHYSYGGGILLSAAASAVTSDARNDGFAEREEL